MNEPSSGDLRARIRICDWTDEPSVDGDLKEDLQRSVDAWAKPEVVSAQMWWGTAQTGEAVTHRFWLRCVQGKTDVRSLTGRTKIIYNSATFRIRRVTDFEERHVWTIVEAEQLGEIDG